MNLQEYFLPGLSIRSVDDFKERVQKSKFGDPLHGIKAGYEMTKLGSAHRFKQSLERLRGGQNPFSGEFIKDTAYDQGHNVQDAWRENWPVVTAIVGGWGSGLMDSGAFSGGSALGAGEGGAGSGGLLGGGGGAAASAGGNFGGQLLQQGQKQSGTPAQMQPQDQQAQQAARLRMLQEMQLQQLRHKPNKTLEEWQQLQMATKNQGLLGGPYG